MTQLWYCERCGVKGNVEIEGHAGVMEGIHRIEDAHRVASPDCPPPYRSLRIITIEALPAQAPPVRFVGEWTEV